MSKKKDAPKVPPWVSVPLSLFSWVVVGSMTVFYFMSSFLLFAPFSFLDRSGKRAVFHLVAQFWARTIMVLCPFWQIRVDGGEPLKKDGKYLMIANHQSMLDILVALAGLPLPFRFLAKKELFSIPFLGWHMALARYIPIDRGNRESGRRAVLTASHWLDLGVSTLFFPEGTRSLDGQIHTFKLGAFKLAKDKGVEVLPLVIDGTGDAIPKKSWRLEKVTRFRLSIGKPISSDKYRTPDLLRDAVRAEMIQRLSRIRSET